MSTQDFSESIKVKDAEKGQQEALKAYYAKQNQKSNPQKPDDGREIGEESGPLKQGRATDLKHGDKVTPQQKANPQQTVQPQSQVVIRPLFQKDDKNHEMRRTDNHEKSDAKQNGGFLASLFGCFGKGGKGSKGGKQGKTGGKNGGKGGNHGGGKGGHGNAPGGGKGGHGSNGGGPSGGQGGNGGGGHGGNGGGGGHGK